MGHIKYSSNGVSLLAITIVFLLSEKLQSQVNDSLSNLFQIQPIIVTTLRVPIIESSVPYSIATMTTRKNIQGLSLSDAVAGIPGLEVNARYNLSVGDRITNRGFGARTQFGVRGVRIIVDDIPVTMADGQSNLEMIDLQDLSYIELLRGPGSSLYGNSSGGVLKLYSNSLPSSPFYFSLSPTDGSNGLFRWDASIGTSFANTKVLGSFSNFHYDGYREHSQADFNRGIIRLGFTLSSSDLLFVNAGYVHFVAQSPGSLTEQESEQNPKLANPLSINNNAGEDGTQFQVAAIWKHQYDTLSLLQIDAYDSYRSVKNLIVGKIIDLPQNAGGVDAIYDTKKNIFGKIVDWSIGADIGFRFNNRKNYVNNKGVEGNMFLNQDERVINVGLFTQVLAPITKMINIAGSIRYDWTLFGATDFLSNPQNIDNSGNRIMSGLSPSFGIVYHFSKFLNCFANIATSFETPTSTELANRPGGLGGFNPDLNPSRAVEYEVGFRGSFISNLQCNITGYIINIKDELIPFEVIPDEPGGQDYYRNAGSSVHRGVEMSLVYSPVSALKTRVSFTYIDAYFKDYIVKGISYSGNKVPGITPARITAEVTYYTPIKLYFSGLMQNNGKVNANDANTSKVKSYTVFNLDMGYDGLSFGKDKKTNLILSGGISNIFNTHYISSVTINATAGRYYEPAPGRSFYLNVRLLYR